MTKKQKIKESRAILIGALREITPIDVRLLSELAQYDIQYPNVGMPLASLSAKYAKAYAKDKTSFPDALERLRSASLLRIEYSPNGARRVFPLQGAKNE